MLMLRLEKRYQRRRRNDDETSLIEKITKDFCQIEKNLHKSRRKIK